MNTKLKHVMTTAFGSLAVMGLLASQPAAATDDQAFPGAMCRADGENAKFFVEAFNTDPNSAHTVVCPIVRDAVNANTLHGTGMFVRDVNPVEDVQCTLFSRDSYGSPIGSYSESSSGANPGGFQMWNGALRTAQYGTLEFICRIPRATSQGLSGITAYVVSEN